MLRRLFGVPVLFMGLALGGWMIYNLFIERLEETTRHPEVPGILVSLGLLYVGTRWIRGQTAGR